MIVSSVFTLKEATTIPTNLVNISETGLEEGYYFNSSLKFLLECQEELLESRRNYYKTILEASENDDIYTVNESFNELLAKAKVIIKKIIAYIETLVKRFVTQIAKFVGSDKYIIKMKSEFAKFKDDDNFDISGYNFTIMEEVPVVNVVGLDLTEFEKELRDINNSDTNLKISKLAEIGKNLSDINAMDNVRGQILNIDTPIPESSYANELFAIFRDGTSDEQKITVNKQYVLKASKDYEGYKDKIKSVKRLQSEINSKYKDIESQINRIATASITVDGDSKININMEKVYSTDYRNTLMNTLNNLVDTVVNHIQRIANLHVQAFAAKLDALNAVTVQDRNILYTALNKIQKNINNTRTMRESLDLTIDNTSHDYSRDLQYRQYQLQKYIMNENQRQFVTECIALSESNISSLKYINEDLKMGKQNKFDKLKELIKSIYEKFLMKMNKFIMNDSKFLKQYKDVILTKKIEPYTLNDMPDYQAGINNIKNHKLPTLDIKSIVSNSESEIQTKVLPAYKGDGDFVDFAKEYFLSDGNTKKDRKSEDLKMEEIYELCLNSKATISVLEKDRDTFISTANKIKQAVLSSTPKTESSLLGEKYYYSTVLESFINEDGETPPQNGTNPQANTQSNANQAQGNAKSSAKLDLNVPKEDKEAQDNKDLKDKVKSDEKGKDAETQAKENKDGDKQKIEETADWYLKSIQTVCAAKITAFQKIYSEYMKILRYHVSQATGSMGSTSNFKEDDINNIKDAMKEYKNAKSEDEKSAAANKIINIYKSRNMVIDAHDVQKLVEKNAGALE